jgi:hypothetical protein
MAYHVIILIFSYVLQFTVFREFNFIILKESRTKLHDLSTYTYVRAIATQNNLICSYVANSKLKFK